MIRSTFGATRFGPLRSNGVASRSLGKPAAMYPGAVASDAQLTIGVDRLQTRLAAPLGPLQTLMTVEDGSLIVPNTLLSIDDEIVQTQAGGGAVWNIIRGRDGTMPATHLASAIVSGFVDAWHHNALVSEIQAIEQTLGPNLSNVPPSPFVLSSAHDFPAQSPGGNLIIGANVITLAPVPLGVNGTNQNHWLYISGGVGAAEPVLITGGTAVSGAATGTVIVTCANAHSGAWTIRSATAGGQEAYYSNGGTGNLYIIFPSGQISIFGPLTVNAHGVHIGGTGALVTTIYQNTPNIDIFRFLATHEGCGIENVGIIGHAASTAGFAINITGQRYFVAQNIRIAQVANGVHNTDGIFTSFRNVWIGEISGGDGFLIDGPLTNVEVWDNITTGSSLPFNAGLRVTEAANAMIINSTFLEGQYGVLFDPLTGKVVASIDMVNIYADHNLVEGLRMIPASGAFITRIRCSQCWFSDAGQTGVRLAPMAGGGINDLLIDQAEISHNPVNGVALIGDVSNVAIKGSSIWNNNGGSGIYVGPGIDGATILGNHIGNDVSWGAGNQLFGVFLEEQAARVVITNNTFKANTTAPISPFPALGLSGAVIIRDNIDIDNVMPAIASAATIQLSWNPIVEITGTITITAINGGWAGREITLIFTAAAPGGLGIGGNIGRAQAAAQNQAIRLTYRGTNWY
jgi:hypothetical protein